MGTALVTQASPLLWASSPAAWGLWLSPGHQPGGWAEPHRLLPLGSSRVHVGWWCFGVTADSGLVYQHLNLEHV